MKRNGYGGKGKKKQQTQPVDNSPSTKDLSHQSATFAKRNDIFRRPVLSSNLDGYHYVRKLNKGDRNISVGNGINILFEVVGTFHLVLESGFNLDLVDTFYVPSMTRNLISVSQLDA
ncbi:hypothetical protein BUALT_Bualt04G0027500 [Buddleja alternifolia]|uniref:Retrovirus-related Pol polyprotein from transposon TNT 1-94-like beta-barrel domain-containing protein n=1 Tax=Buddleja alternifolia TaxID=168488 RepID=A0AAV6XTW3_9LAMI|nr:hypothetical protein BUALT_Bualt04G0027500 [Buddleja alternifolia]